MNQIQDIDSKGLMGLPHFRNSRVSMRMDEPIWTNLFTAAIVLPDAIDGMVDHNLFLEEVTSIQGVDTDKIPAAGTVQYYKWAERHFANSGPDTTSLNLTLDFQFNISGSVEGHPEAWAVKYLRAWYDLIWNPLTGSQGLKAEYVAPQLVVTIHDKAYQPFWQWTFHHVFPTKGLDPLNLNYQNKTDIYKGTLNLVCDYWDETIL